MRRLSISPSTIRRAGPRLSFYLVAAATCLLLVSCAPAPAEPRLSSITEDSLIPLTGLEPAESPFPTLSSPHSAPSPTPHPGLTATLEATPPLQTIAPTTLPSPTATPAPRLFQLASGGCCPGSFWSPDGQSVLFLDNPDPSRPAELWQIPKDGGKPVLYSSVVGNYSSDLSLVVFYNNGQTFIERLEDGQIWLVPSAGAAAYISPDNQYTAWTSPRAEVSPGEPDREVWVSLIDGSHAWPVVQLYAGSFSSWFPDGRMLLTGFTSAEQNTISYWSFSMEKGELVELARAHRLRGPVISPDGGWLAYQTFFSPDPDENGLWVVNTDTLERRRVEPFGGFRWRSEGRLLIVPLEPGSISHRLVEFDAATGAALPLTGQDTLTFKIAGGDFSVSPDGRRVSFVSADDYNIWVIDLP